MLQLAQVAFQEGTFLAKHFEKVHELEATKFTIQNPTATDNIDRLKKKFSILQDKLPVFEYVNQGALAYIGSEKAVADLVWVTRLMSLLVVL